MQHLAYLKDGEVKRVHNGMLGAVRPMNLISLKDHAAAEKKLAKLQAKERIAQAEWVKHGGITENERALIAHAEAEKKILEL